ncbi:hypothetical protein BU15DRAFT_89876 [Melanogaster broomeanus]|nr:hypothetical protein BU15DRAFT_89876 [Melanogaster broomeanus]
MPETIPPGINPQNEQADKSHQYHPPLLTSSSSFVYPVRSLLSGIQPAGRPPGEPIPSQVSSLDYYELSSIKHPSQFSEVAAAAFSSVAYLIPPPVAQAAQPQLNLSELGYVHLPPLPQTPEQVIRDPGHSAGKAWVQPASFGAEPGQTRPSSDSSDEEQRTTTRYTHVEDQNGHHVVTGRKGVPTRCEAEPIRTPGAVQGFGVLIVVEEDQEAELLVVRQVSENSRTILGLSPTHLFFAAAQAGILWDNIQFLNEPQTTTEGWGGPGSATSDDSRDSEGRRSWTCWCAVHRPPASQTSTASIGLIILEFELERDTMNPLYPSYSAMQTESLSPDSPPGSGSTGNSSETPISMVGESFPASSATAVSVFDRSLSAFAPEDEEDDWQPTTEDIISSTTNYAKPIPALERLRRTSSVASQPATDPGPRSRRKGFRRKGGNSGAGMMDINEQLGATADLETCLKVVFHRVMIYQFGRGMEWRSSSRAGGLATISRPARQLYAINTVRILYDRTQTTARIIVRNKSDLEAPLNMTHSYLRAMSPIHLKYLENMGVQAALSVSIMTFGSLWGLISCHSYGSYGMRVSFPVRQMLRLLSETISRHIERLNYARRLQIRKLVSPIPHERYSSGYVVSNADDLLRLFGADYGILVIGEGAKIIGPNCHGQEILVMAEYLRLKQFNMIQVSQAVIGDYPDLRLSTGLAVIAGLLYVPLSGGGKDFIALLRKGQPRSVRWAGRLNKGKTGTLEPRKSFKTWSEIVAGRSRAWTEEEVETAGVLSLVYGKFIEVWRQKESAIQTTNLTNILLSNASHEVRTPLNHIINYLEMAMNGSLDAETRENLSRSYTASKACPLPLSCHCSFSLHRLTLLQDLTRVESGKEVSFIELFDLRSAIEECVRIYHHEAKRRDIEFILEVEDAPRGVIGDVNKIKTVVANLTANALKYTTKGSVSVQCRVQNKPEGLRDPSQTTVEINVSDTGCGIPNDKLESIFHEFEQVESSGGSNPAIPGVGLGLAIVVRIMEQLGGQLRVDSQIGVGSRFSSLIPLELAPVLSESGEKSPSSHAPTSLQSRSRAGSGGSPGVENPIEGLTSNRMDSSALRPPPPTEPAPAAAEKGSLEPCCTPQGRPDGPPDVHSLPSLSALSLGLPGTSPVPDGKLRVLIVELSQHSQDNDINRKILAKRLQKDGHTVLWDTNGQEGLDRIESDGDFDCILMDIMMPILNGFESTERIREVESKTRLAPATSRRPSMEFKGRIPIFAVSASLLEQQRAKLMSHGFDGWILKPIDFARLRVLLKGITDPSQRKSDTYKPGCNWELGGWLQ